MSARRAVRATIAIVLTALEPWNLPGFVSSQRVKAMRAAATGASNRTLAHWIPLMAFTLATTPSQLVHRGVERVQPRVESQLHAGSSSRPRSIL